MKTKIGAGWKLVVLLAGLPFVAASLQTPQPATNADGDAADVVDLTTDIAPADTNNLAQPAPLSGDAISGVSAACPVAPNVQLSGGASEVVRLAQGGVGEDVMLAYISSVNSRFNVGSNQILYLNDIGVSGGVIKAMMDRDAAIDAASRAAYAASLPPPTQPTVADTNVPPMTDYGTYPPADNSGITAYPPDMDYSSYTPGNYATMDDSGAFYDSLAPYGSWSYIGGLGYCWQPTVYRAQPRLAALL